jgi:L-ascorbate metabolism protein UlaG (beta-lactamase superfamily)
MKIMNAPKSLSVLFTLFVFAACFFLPASVQQTQSSSKPREIDTEKTASGNLKIVPITHASVMLEWRGKEIYIDPWSQGDYSGLAKSDLILITDIHPDHMDLKGIAAVKDTDTIIIGPEAVAKTIPEAQILRNGEKTSLIMGGTLTIEAVPMYNLTRGPSPGELYHTKGRGNGYVLDIGGKRLYFSGDTECVPEIKSLERIDIAFLCMNLPYTMTAQEAADCVKTFRPMIVYPYHYRGQDPNVFADALKGEKEIEVRIRKWY